MAKRKKNSYTASKIEPSELTFTFSTPSGGVGSVTNSYIDLSQVASLVNRRFYRQGINWAVAGFKFITATPSQGASIKGTISIQKLPNTWIMSNAWEKSMRTWLKMSNQALEDNESVRPRFMDFKVFADGDHHQQGVLGNLLPVNYGGVPTTPGDWDYSTIHIPDSANVDPTSTGFAIERLVNEYDLIATGPSYPGVSPVTTKDGVSLIEGYASSRALPNLADPNTPDDMEDADGTTPQNWMTAIFNEGLIQESEVLEDLREQNNVAPYPFENDVTVMDTMYPGGQNQLRGLVVHDVSNVSASTIGGNTYMKGGNFPCGLVKITHEVSQESIAHNLLVQIDLVPGSHRGYMCEPMTEM